MKSFRFHKPSPEEKPGEKRKLGCFLMCLAPLAFVFGGAWLLAEGPGPDGRIHGAEIGKLSPLMFLLGLAAFVYGSKLWSGKS